MILLAIWYSRTPSLQFCKPILEFRNGSNSLDKVADVKQALTLNLKYSAKWQISILGSIKNGPGNDVKV